MNLKRIISCILLADVLLFANAQSYEEYIKKGNQKFNEYKERLNKEFEEYRIKINQEFSDYMREKWPEFKEENAMQPPVRPKPPIPVVDDTKEEKPSDITNVTDIKSPLAVPDIPSPISPQDDDKSFSINNDANILKFNFYGTDCEVPLRKDINLSLKNPSENSVADCWNVLSKQMSSHIIQKCLQYKNNLNLPDWGYLRFLDFLGETAFPNQPNEATIFKMYILSNSGYKVRIGKCGDRLFLFIPTKDTLYNYRYVKYDGENYYIYDRDRKGEGGIQMFNRNFPNEQEFSLLMTSPPRLSIAPSDKKTISSKRNPEINAEIAVNTNLINFYNDYPQHDCWQIDIYTSLSEDAKKQLYPTLKKALNEKNEAQAVNILLHFVQTGFKYMTDEEQFGYERPLFPDETLYYPYSDCEDRAILFAVLVRELLGLDVVLLNYPEHIATAVHFNGNVEGDHFIVDAKKYVVCDPTYINANVGRAMPQFRGVGAEIIKL